MKTVSLVMAYNGAGHLLFGKRNDNGKWTLPGGSADQGEGPVEAARRELFEETGLTPISLSFFKTISGENTTIHFFTAYVRGTPHSDNDPDNECGKWEFIDVSDGIPENVANKLAGPKNIEENIILQVFDIKKAEARFNDIEDMFKAQKGDADPSLLKPKMWRSKDNVTVPGLTHPKREEYNARFAQSLASYFTRSGDPGEFNSIKVPIDSVTSINPVHNKDRYDVYKKMYAAGDRPPPVLVNKNSLGRYVLLDGNHRYQAAKDTKQTHLYALEAPAPKEVVAEAKPKKLRKDIDFASDFTGLAEQDAFDELLKDEHEPETRNEIDRMIDLDKIDVALAMDGLTQRQVARMAIEHEHQDAPIWQKIVDKLNPEGLSHVIREYANLDQNHLAANGLPDLVKLDKITTADNNMSWLCVRASVKPALNSHAGIALKWTPENRRQFFHDVIKTGRLTGGGLPPSDASLLDKIKFSDKKMSPEDWRPRQLGPVISGAPADVQKDWVKDFSWMCDGEVNGYIAVNTTDPEVLDIIAKNHSPEGLGPVDGENASLHLAWFNAAKQALFNKHASTGTLVSAVKNADQNAEDDPGYRKMQLATMAVANTNFPEAVGLSLGNTEGHSNLFRGFLSAPNRVISPEGWKEIANNKKAMSVAIGPLKHVGGENDTDKENIENFRKGVSDHALTEFIRSDEGKYSIYKLLDSHLLKPKHVLEAMDSGNYGPSEMAEALTITVGEKGERPNPAIDDSVRKDVYLRLAAHHSGPSSGTNSRAACRLLKDASSATVEELSATRNPGVLRGLTKAFGETYGPTPSPQALRNVVDSIKELAKQPDQHVTKSIGQPIYNILNSSKKYLPPHLADELLPYNPKGFLASGTPSQEGVDKYLNDQHTAIKTNQELKLGADVRTNDAKDLLTSMVAASNTGKYNLNRHISSFLDSGLDEGHEQNPKEAKQVRHDMFGLLEAAHLDKTLADKAISKNPMYMQAVGVNKHADITPEARTKILDHFYSPGMNPPDKQGLLANRHQDISHHFEGNKLSEDQIKDYYSRPIEGGQKPVLTGLGRSASLTDEMASHLKANMNPSLNDGVESDFDRHISPNFPDQAHDLSVTTKMKTAKLRRIRDHIIEQGVQELQPNKFPKDLQPLLQGIQARTKSGNISAPLIQQTIDQTPGTHYNISHGTWDGAQRHSNEESKVFQLNINNEHIKQMKAAGVYDTFKRFQAESNHPVSPTTAGWIRYTESGDDNENTPAYAKKLLNSLSDKPELEGELMNEAYGVSDGPNGVSDKPETKALQRGLMTLGTIAGKNSQQNGNVPDSFDSDAVNTAIDYLRGHNKYHALGNSMEKVNPDDLSIHHSLVTDTNRFKEHFNYNEGDLAIPEDERKAFHAAADKHINAITHVNEPLTTIPKASSEFIQKAREYFPDHFGITVKNLGRPPENADNTFSSPKDGIFIDEIQSDHAIPVAVVAKNRAKGNYLSRNTHGNLTEPEQLNLNLEAEKEGDDAYNRVNQSFPADHQKKIRQIVFGDQHPSKVLAESFLEHLRSKGEHNRKIHIHTVESKAPISLHNEGKAVPVHFKETYQELPKELGFKPTSYGNLATETGKISEPVQEGVARKFEEDWSKEFQQLCKSIPDSSHEYLGGVSHDEPVVDHTMETTHPSVEKEHTDFKNSIANSEHPVAPIDFDDGIQAKQVWGDTTATGYDGYHKPKFIAKPYHEDHGDMLGGWAEAPLAGWSEGTFQDMFHAADMGHNIQKSFVHNEPGRKPMTVIATDPTATGFHMPHVNNASPESQHTIAEQGRRLAIFDFLSNNLDRHGGNAMLTRHGDDKHPSNLLAIDNALGFQYLSASKREQSNFDSLSNYAHSNTVPGLLSPISEPINRTFNEWAPNTEDWKDTVQNWWPSVKDKVMNSFHNRLSMVNDPTHREHIKENFLARANHLNDLAASGLDNIMDWHKSPVSVLDRVKPKYGDKPGDYGSEPDDESYKSYNTGQSTAT